MISISRRLTLSLVPLLLVSVLLIVQGGVWLYDQAQRDYLTQLLQREACADPGQRRSVSGHG